MEIPTFWGGKKLINIATRLLSSQEEFFFVVVVVFYIHNIDKRLYRESVTETFFFPHLPAAGCDLPGHVTSSGQVK